MPLPTISVPKHQTTLPSSGETVQFRPYLTREEKMLMIAKESGSEGDIIASLQKLVEDCVDEVTDASAMPLFDFEYLFLKLRAVSSGETATPTITCGNKYVPEDSEDGKEIECKNTLTLSVNLNDLEAKTFDGHENNIKLTDDGIGVVMRYPTVGLVQKMHAGKNAKLSDTERTFKLLGKCIETIYDAESTYPTSESTDAEINKFVDSLTGEMRGKIEDQFFNKMPRIEHVISKKCPKCGKEHKITLSGIQNFF